MKKLITTVAYILITFSMTSPAIAASWTTSVNAAIASNNLGLIDRIVASNPDQAGPIASYLLQQAHNHTNDRPGLSVDLFKHAVPLASQIAPADVSTASANVRSLLLLAKNEDFQEEHKGGAASIYASALSFTSLPNIADHDPALRRTVLAESGDYMAANPDEDKDLRDTVLLAQGFDLQGVNVDPRVNRRMERFEEPRSPSCNHPSNSSPDCK